MSHNAAQSAGTANRARGIGAQGGDTESRCHGCGRTRRRSARDSLQVPGIFRRSKRTYNAADAEGKLMQVQLANDDGPALLQLPNDLGVFRWYAVAILVAGRRG